MIELNKNITLNDLWVGKKVSVHVWNFAVVFAILFAIIGGIKLYLGYSFTTVSFWFALGVLFLVLAKFTPKLLFPLWFYWMKMALILGLFVTSVILTIAWFLMFVPVGIIFKIIGKQTLDFSFRKNAVSYWEDKNKKSSDFKLLERQF